MSKPKFALHQFHQTSNSDSSSISDANDRTHEGRGWVGYTTTMEVGVATFSVYIGEMYLTRCRYTCGCGNYTFAGLDHDNGCYCGNIPPNKKCWQSSDANCVQVLVIFLSESSFACSMNCKLTSYAYLIWQLWVAIVRITIISNFIH